jgi:hypothetical protein
MGHNLDMPDVLKFANKPGRPRAFILPMFFVVLKGTASAVPQQAAAKRPTALPKAGAKSEGRSD